MQVMNNQSIDFVKKLNVLLTNIKNKKAEKNKKICVNVGDRYALYLTQLDNEKIAKLHSIKCFPDHNLAIIFFKKQIRNEFLKNYKIVKFIIKHLTIDNNGKILQCIIGEFCEDRTGSMQRMLQFLRK
jgi:hypothetical protein